MLTKTKPIKKKEQNDKKKKKKPQRREVTFPEDYDWDKAYFVRATVEGKTDMCSPRNYTHVGVPLIGEDQQPYRRPEWEIPPKAAPIPGAQPKSEPTVPVPMEEPMDELIEISSDSSAGTFVATVDPSQSLRTTTQKAFAYVRSAEFQEVLSSMRHGEERELWISQAIDDAAAAVAATAEFRLVVDRLQALQEHRAQQGQPILSFVDQMAELALQAETDETGAPMIPHELTTRLAAAPPKRSLSPPPKTSSRKQPQTTSKSTTSKTLKTKKPSTLSPSPQLPEPKTGPGLSSGPEMEPVDISSSTSPS